MPTQNNNKNNKKVKTQQNYSKKKVKTQQNYSKKKVPKHVKKTIKNNKKQQGGG